MQVGAVAPSSESRFATSRLSPLLLVLVIALESAGCFLMSRTPPRPHPTESVSGPALYVEGCQDCHATPVGAHYAQSLHAAMGIRCGQCHAPDGHPNFLRPIEDGKCGGCHQPQYQQTLASKHFATRELRALDGDPAARQALRADGFTAPTATGRRFVGDSSSRELGGRLCAACHYDEHRLGLRPVDRADFCTGCHAGREQHFPAAATPGLANRCMECHVRVGQTVKGQVVNIHLFARPGATSAGR